MAEIKRLLILIISFALLFSAFGCGKKSAGAKEILDEILKDFSILPTGDFYLAGAEEGGENYLSSDMIKTLYGDEAESDAFEAVEDFAIFLSSRVFPFEVAVFRCVSASEAARVYLMCKNRAELLGVLLRGTEFASLAEDIFVIKSQNFVVMGVSDKPDLLEKAIKDALD